MLLAKFEDLPSLVGHDLGHSDYTEITQPQVNMFAVATNDHQWIHVDEERAAAGPFGGTIAHGFLTLSLIVPLWSELFDVADVSSKLNYGLDRVRFTSPVRVGARVRLHSVIAAVEEVKGSTQITSANTLEIEGQERPAAVADFIARFYA